MKEEIKSLNEKWKGRTEPTEEFIKWLNSPESIKQRETVEEMIKKVKGEKK